MALWFAKTPAIREFGSLLVIGIIAVCFCSIIATLSVLGIREYKSPTKGEDFSQGRLSRTAVFLGSLPQRTAVPLAIVSVVILLSGIAVEGKLALQTDPISWVNPHSQAIKDINQLKAATGSDNEIAMRISTAHPWSNQTVDYVINFSHQLEKKYPTTLFPGAGLINTVDQFITIKGMKEVPPTGADMQGIYLIAPPGIVKTTVADHGGALDVIFLGRTDTLDQLAPVVKDLEGGINAPPGITVAPGGIATVGVGLIQNLEASRVKLTYLAILFVGLFLTIRLRSLIRALLSLVPVLVAVGAVSLIGVIFHLKLSPVTAVAGPLVVAVCTEFTSLMLLRFVEERGRGLAPPRGDGRHVQAHREGLHGLGHDRHRRRGGPGLVVDAAAERLRHHRRHQHHRGTAERPGGAATHLGLGRPAQLGVARAHQDAAPPLRDDRRALPTRRHR